MSMLFDSPQFPAAIQAATPVAPLVTPTPVNQEPDEDKKKHNRTPPQVQTTARSARQSTLLTNEVDTSDLLGG